MCTTALVSLGRPSIDTYFQVPHLLAPGEKMSVDSVFITPGGVAGNFAAHLANFGAQVTVHATPVTDSNAHLDIADLERNGAEIVFDSESLGTAHQCYIFLTDDGQRAILIDEAKDADVIHAGLQRLLARETRTFDIAYFGVWGTRHRELTEQARPLARLSAATIENSSWPRNTAPSEFEHVDLIFCSDETYLNNRSDFDSLVETAELDLVVTYGSRGSEFRTRDQVHFSPAIKDGGTIVDTTGAGDCFAAAFCWFHDQGVRGEELLSAANHAARFSLTKIGPRP